MNRIKVLQLLVSLSLLLVQPLQAQTLSLSLKNTPIGDVMMMLSKQQQLNIFLGDGVEGDVTVNLYNMDTVDAVHAIAESAGYAVEQAAGEFGRIWRASYAMSNAAEDVHITRVEELLPETRALLRRAEELDDRARQFRRSGVDSAHGLGAFYSGDPQWRSDNGTAHRQGPQSEADEEAATVPQVDAGRGEVEAQETETGAGAGQKEEHKKNDGKLGFAVRPLDKDAIEKHKENAEPCCGA